MSNYAQMMNNKFSQVVKNKGDDNIDEQIRLFQQKINEKDQLLYDREISIVKKGNKLKSDVVRKIKLSKQSDVLFQQIDGDKKTNYKLTKDAKSAQLGQNEPKEVQQSSDALVLNFSDRDHPVTIYFKSNQEFIDFKIYLVQKNLDQNFQQNLKSLLKQSQIQIISQLAVNLAQKLRLFGDEQQKALDQQKIQPIPKEEQKVNTVPQKIEEEDPEEKARLLKEQEEKNRIQKEQEEQIRKYQEELEKQKNLEEQKRKQDELQKNQEDEAKRKKQLEQQEQLLKKQTQQSDISQNINISLKDLEISENTPIHQPTLLITIKKNSQVDGTPRIINGQSIVDQTYFQSRYDLKLSGEQLESYNFWVITDQVKEINVKNFKLDDYIIFEIEDQIQLNDQPVTVQAQYFFYQLYDSFHQGKIHFLIFDYHKSQVQPIFIEFQTFQTPSLTKDIKTIKQLEDYCFDKNLPVYDPVYQEEILCVDKDLLPFLKDYFQEKETYQDYQLICQQRYFKDVVVLVKNFFKRKISRCHYKIYTNILQIQSIEEQLQELKDYQQTQEFEEQNQDLQNFENQYKNVFAVDDYKQVKIVKTGQSSSIQSLWNYQDQKVIDEVHKLCFSGIPSDFKLIFYSCMGQLYHIQQDLILQIKQKTGNDVKINDLYSYFKQNVIKNTLLQSTLIEQFNSYFKCEYQKTYKQQLIFDVLQTFIYTTQNFRINNVRLLYSTYIIPFVYKVSQLTHNMFGCEENEDQQLQFYESCIFWAIICITLNLNNKYQIFDQEVETQFQINQLVIEDLMFLRSQIQLFFKDLYQVMIDQGISVEILFGDKLLNFCADLLNTEIYFRVIDFAFSQVSDVDNFTNIALILALLDKFQKLLVKAKSFTEFKEMFYFCCRYYFEGDDLVQSILNYQQKISSNNYQDFQNYIFERRNYYKLYEQQQKFVQAMILQSQEDGLNLCDIINIMGKHATRQELIPNEESNNIDLENSTAIDYKQVYIKVWKQFNIKSKKGIHLYLHKIVLFWPFNTIFMLEIIQDDEVLIQLKIENESDQNFNLYKYIPYVENQKLQFKLYDVGIENKSNLLIKQGSLNVQSFYTNTIYQHEIELKDCSLLNNEDFYDSFLQISCMVFTQPDNKINSYAFTKNINVGPPQYMFKIMNIGDLDPSIFDQNRLVEENLKKILNNNLDQFYISSIYLPSNYWKQDSIMNEQALQDVVKSSKLFSKFTDFGNLYKLYSNGQKFYFKDLLTSLIMNCNGTFKQKINQIYSQFQGFELCQEQKNTLNIETVKNFIHYLYDIFQIPARKSEIENWIEFALYKINNYVIKAKLKKMDKKLDLTQIFQKCSQYNYQNYGTFDVILGTQDQLIYLEKTLKFYFYQDEINQLFDHDGSANLLVKYYQAGVLKNQEFIINQNFQVLKAAPLIPVQSQSGIEQLFLVNENIINLQNYENTVNFEQFYQIFQKMPLLQNILMQKEIIFSQNREYIHSQFVFKFQGQVIIKIEYQDFNKQYQYYDHQQYLQNIEKLQSQPVQQGRPINENTFYGIDYLDIFENLRVTINRLNNFIITKQLKTPFNNQLKLINFDNYEIKLTKDITPDGIKILSLNDIFSLSQKFYKKIEFTINFQKSGQSELLNDKFMIARSLYRVASENNKYNLCKVLFYHPRSKPSGKNDVFGKQHPTVKFFGVQFMGDDQTIYLKKPFEIEFPASIDLNSIPVKPLPDQYK